MSYNNNMCLQAAKKLSDEWKTTRPVPDTMTASTINVRIPCNTDEPSCYTWNDVEFYLWLFVNNIWAMGFKDNKGVWYLRLSCQIYNEASDYERLKRAIDELGVLSKSMHFVLSPVKPVIRMIAASLWSKPSPSSCWSESDSETELFASYPTVLSWLLSLAVYLLSYVISILSFIIHVGKCIF